MGFRVLLAPDWIAVGELCDHDKECRPARARSLDKKDWQPLGLPAHARLSSVEYDAKTDRLVLLIDDGKANQVWAGKRGGKLARVEAKELDARPVATTMNGAGALVLAYAYPSRVVTLGADGKLGKPVYLPFEAASLDLAGDHGYANASSEAWETGDSGAHWAKVASGGAGLPACAPSGCLQGDAVRVGWDLPDATAIVSSEDLGKTWSTVVWSLGEPVTLLSLEGAPYLGFGFTTQFGPALPTGVLSFPKLSNDPPPVRRLAEGALAIGDKGFEACSAKAKSGLRAYTWGDSTGRYVTFRLQTSEGASTELPTSGQYLRVGADGSVCTDMVLASSPTDLGSFQLLERPDDPAHAWLVKTKDDGTSTLQAAVCTP